MEMIEMPREEFERINIIKSEIDLDLLEQFVSSLKDIKEGRIRRVK